MQHITQEVSIMSVSSIAAGTVSAPPPVQPQDQAKASAQAPAQVQGAKKDTVNISPEATKLASDGDSPAVEATEGASEKAKETSNGTN